MTSKAVRMQVCGDKDSEDILACEKKKIREDKRLSVSAIPDTGCNGLARLPRGTRRWKVGGVTVKNRTQEVQ